MKYNFINDWDSECFAKRLITLPTAYCLLPTFLTIPINILY